MRFGLPEETMHKINSVFEKHTEVEQVWIYGSRAKSNYRNGSDIDLTLKGQQLSSAILSKMENEIDDLNIPYLFDISIFNTLESPDLEAHINRVGKLFYERKPR